MENGSVEGTGGNLRIKQRGSLWSSEQNHGFKQCLPNGEQLLVHGKI